MPLRSTSSEDTFRETWQQRKRLTRHAQVWSIIRAWWYLPVHLIWCIAMSTVVLGVLHRRPFPVHSTAGYSFTQSDVSTLVSVGLKITSIICSAIQSILAWRCTFITLERKGLTYSQLSNQLLYKIGPLIPRNAFITWISISLFLLWPAQLASPILSGAITWLPYDGLHVQQSRSIEVATAYPDEYSNWGNLLVLDGGLQSPGQQVLRGAGATTVNMAADQSNGRDLINKPRRIVPELRNIPVGSYLGNITMPHLRTSNFSWLNTLEFVPSDVRAAVEDVTSNWFNYSRGLTPLYSFPGAVALTRKNNFSSMQQGELPEPTVVSARTFAALYVFKHNATEQGLRPCSTNSVSRQSEPPVQEYVHMQPIGIAGGNNISYCYAVADVTFEAGVVTCKKSAKIIAESLTECQNEAFDVLAPDPLVGFSLALVPETIMHVVNLNNTGWDSTKGAENYTRNMLNMAYQGAWSALTYHLNTQAPLNSVVYERVDAVQADVTAWRIFLWLFLNATLTVAGLIVYCFQKQADRPVVNKPVLSALMVDPSHICQHDQTGVCRIANMSSTSQESLLRLKCTPRHSGEECHDTLDFHGSELVTQVSVPRDQENATP